MIDVIIRGYRFHEDGKYRRYGFCASCEPERVTELALEELDENHSIKVFDDNAETPGLPLIAKWHPDFQAWEYFFHNKKKAIERGY